MAQGGMFCGVLCVVVCVTSLSTLSYVTVLRVSVLTDMSIVPILFASILSPELVLTNASLIVLVLPTCALTSIDGSSLGRIALMGLIALVSAEHPGRLDSMSKHSNVFTVRIYFGLY